MLGVEERSQSAEAYGASQCGGLGSENVGMSSKKAGENPAHRKPKVSWAMTVIPGLGGPNRGSERCRGMEEQVNIPALP